MDKVGQFDSGGSAIGKISIDRNPYYSVFWNASGRGFLADAIELFSSESNSGWVFASHNDFHEGRIVIPGSTG